MLNITQKVSEMMNECSYVAKNGYNTGIKYKYAQASDVTRLVRPALLKYKLITVINHEVIDFSVVKNKSGNEEKIATVKISVTLIDTETGETLVTTGLGSGIDHGDKAIMKAETAALKYAFLQLLSIETGDDPEGDVSVDERMGATTPEAPVISEDKHTISFDENKLYKCSNCPDEEVTAKVADFSMRKFNRILCYKCQKKQ